jgi:hypothetical protein
MFGNARKLVLGSLGGFTIAIVVVASFVWVGYLPSVQATGQLVIKVKDAPAELEELWMMIDAVKVHRKGDGNTTWSEVSVLQEDPFDLLSLTNFSIVLAVQELLVGNYTEIRLHILGANATIDGNSTPLNVTTEWMKIKAHFEIRDTKVTTLTIDIEINEQPILNANILMPVAFTDVAIEYDE